MYNEKNQTSMQGVRPLILPLHFLFQLSSKLLF